MAGCLQGGDACRDGRGIALFRVAQRTRAQPKQEVEVGRRGGACLSRPRRLPVSILRAALCRLRRTARVHGAANNQRVERVFKVGQHCHRGARVVEGALGGNLIRVFCGETNQRIVLECHSPVFHQLRDMGGHNINKVLPVSIVSNREGFDGNFAPARKQCET